MIRTFSFEKKGIWTSLTWSPRLGEHPQEGGILI